GDAALRTAHEAHLAGLELDRAALRTRLVQDPVQLVQALHLRQLRTDPGQRRVAVLVGNALADRVPDLGIGQAHVRTHHRFVELRAGDDAVAPDLHVAAEAQPVHARIQRTDAVGQRLGQHRHDEAGEIDRGRALLRFVVQRRSRAYVVGYVGDRHDQ